MKLLKFASIQNYKLILVFYSSKWSSMSFSWWRIQRCWGVIWKQKINLGATPSSNTPYLYERKKYDPNKLLVNKNLPYKKPSVSFYHTTITMINLLYQLTNLSPWCGNGQRKRRERFSSGCLLVKVHLLGVNLRHMWWNQVRSPATALKQET